MYHIKIYINIYNIYININIKIYIIIYGICIHIYLYILFCFVKLLFDTRKLVIIIRNYNK